MGKVLHASASGYFPNCIKIGPRDQPDPNNDFSGFTDMTLDQAMGLLWRVKTWECLVSGTQVTQFPGEQAIITTLTDTTYQEMPLYFTYFPRNQEEDLVCGIQVAFRSPGIPLTYIFQNGSTLILNFDVSLYIGSNDISKVGDVYFPTLATDYGSFTSVDPDPESEFGKALGTYNISFLDYVITRTTYTSIYVNGNNTIDIRAKEYWSYGGTYDTATGEPL